MPKVLVVPDNVTAEVTVDQDILSGLRASGLKVEGICNGRGTCGKCLIRIVSGAVTNSTERERSWQHLIGGDNRLACQTRALTDVTVLLPEISRTSEAKILIAGRAVETRLSPTVRAMDIEASPPTLEDQRPDIDRLLALTGASSYDPSLLRVLPKLARDMSWRVRAVARGSRLVDLLPIGKGRVLGVAADIGTTTVVAYLYDLMSGEPLAVKADYNGQIKFGEDVVSRMSFAIDKEGALAALQAAIVETLNRLIGTACAQVGSRVSDVYEIVVAGNSVMTSLLIGADPRAMAKAPYTPPFLSPVEVDAGELGVSAHQRAILKTMPLISGYVGGDVVGDILVSGVHRSNSVSLLVDIGTNGEAVVGSSKGMMAASCAAGPALEGYGITRGMRAMEGAMESVAIDPRTGELFYRTIGNGKPRGICGSGVVDAVAAMLISGVLDSSGRIVPGSSNRVVEVSGETMFVIARGDESANGMPIGLTQGDIRKFQLAKAAIYAASSVLMSEMKVRPGDLERVYMAGAFGNYISPVHAMIVGLIPEVRTDRVVQIGNGSGMGACAVLRNEQLWQEVQIIADKTQHVELNLVPSFQSEFVEATHLPHKREGLFERTRETLRSMMRKP